MAKILPLQEKLIDILSVARFAPSVHNAQPWKVSVNNNTLLVRVDEAHILKHGDPTGRQTIISLGIFCESLAIAAKHEKYAVERTIFDGKTVTIQLKPSTDTANTSKLVKLLMKRSSDRSIYSPTNLSPTFIKDIENLTNVGDGLSIKVTTDRTIIGKVADLTSHGIGLALSNPLFRQELSLHLVEPWSQNKRGIAVGSLYINWVLAILQPILMKLGVGTKAESSLERKRWLSASGIVFIFGDGDLSHYWFNAGQAYLRISLQIEASGLSQATSAAIVEASDYHEDLEKMMGTDKRLLGMLRVGKGSNHKYYSPRVNAEDIAT